MKFQYASDLHLEFPANEKFLLDNPLIPVGEILILAGDIVPFRFIEKYAWFFDFISANFKTVYWIAGNHEYYGEDAKEKQGKFYIPIRDNVFLVNNFSVVHENTKLIFSTLWTYISPQKAYFIQNGLNDFFQIRYGDKLLSVKIYKSFFKENIKFISQEVSENTNENCIVVTHHVPTYQHYPQEYLNSNINEAFAVDLDDFILNSKIDTWIYGHHHRNVSAFKLGQTTFVTNQLGYVQSKEHLDFQRDCLLSIG
jgi:predicted phosphohydrolase